MKQFGDLCYLLGKLRGAERILEESVANANTEQLKFAGGIESLFKALEKLNNEINDDLVAVLKEKADK